ncbi:MAG: MBOAT family protein [Lachnospiraceae bacterium]|nr:MBOAT family protein [Lachnospiraceae bacterium]
MVLSGLLFTFYFLPFSLILYHILPQKLKNPALCALSLIFYIYGAGHVSWILPLDTFFCILTLSLMEKKDEDPGAKKVLLAAGITVQLLPLLFFKFFTGAALPFGISFFTFRSVSLLADHYTKKTEKHIPAGRVFLYLCFFPQLSAGPIARYGDLFGKASPEGRHGLPESFCSGAARFLTGFCKKLLIADRLAAAADEVFSRSSLSGADPRLLWLASLCYSLQLFFDFSGYSDMAIGICDMLGFRCDENFNYPYACSDANDFWRRWHISLSRWFRDYVYIPLGGSRVSAGRTVLNLLIVWILTGIWHGSGLNFIAWGMIHFILITSEKYLVKPRERKGFFRILWRIFILLAVNIAWVFFRCRSLSHALEFTGGMFLLTPSRFTEGDALIRCFREYGIFIAAALLFSTPAAPKAGEFLKKHTGKIYSYGMPVVRWLFFIISLSYLLLQNHNPFIYANF